MDAYALSILTMIAFSQEERSTSLGSFYVEIRLPYLHALPHSSLRSNIYPSLRMQVYEQRLVTKA